MAVQFVTPEQVEACREEYGDAHDHQLAYAGECAWCGAYDPEIPEGHIDMETGNVYDGYGNMIEQHGGW